MDTIDYDYTEFVRPDAGDAHLLVLFYSGTMKNEAKSLEAGRPIIDDVECIKIIIPGDKNAVVDRPATPQDKKRFAQQYASWKQGREGDEQISGTRLQEWPFLTRGQVEELRYLNIKTVEQLANANDAINFHGLQGLKNHARSWLATAKDSALAAQQAERLNAQDAKIAELTRLLEDQAAALAKAQQRR